MGHCYLEEFYLETKPMEEEKEREKMEEDEDYNLKTT